VVHAGNPSYSGGRDQEDRGLKPAQANSSKDLISKKLSQKKKGWWSGSRCKLSSSATKKKKKETKKKP
jgi:hypothetical protein